MKLLKGIDGAVNGKQPEEPTLRVYVAESHKAIGRIEGALNAHVDDDRAHRRH